ncbi:MAG TPA: hypothetical protein PLB59_12735 [Bacteroidales bacterium]|nr:hypothetical protein [Bacteroidales bacterium]HNZ42921.1 hypothetical protein [Bacteroidales bacterium]HPI31417.1 hypothetical protein [Bacteroidales bacterium]HQN17269.1 hypothetical protein [Bacteroidales bacterium]HQP16820.1 hypothetical protein [Bacteroidales bacterium]
MTGQVPFQRACPFYFFMEHLRQKLIYFSAKTKELESCGGPEENGALFEEVLTIKINFD